MAYVLQQTGFYPVAYSGGYFLGLINNLFKLLLQLG
jgi:hypothetical protein